LDLDLVCNFLCLISVDFKSNLGNPAPRHHEALGGFFGASQGRLDNTSFEGGNKSGAVALAC
jgi:hypothetical protein